MSINFSPEHMHMMQEQMQQMMQQMPQLQQQQQMQKELMQQQILQQQQAEQQKNVATPEKYKKWNSIYAMYLDATRSLKQGRVIPKEKAVQNPTFHQLVKALKELIPNEEVFLEPEKRNPRDQLNPGRVRIQFYNEDGSFKIQGYSDLKSFYVAVAALITEIQKKETELKESKKLAIQQKQKKPNKDAVRTFQGDQKKKKARR